MDDPLITGALSAKPEDWPDPDLRLWFASITSGDMFDDVATGAHLRDTTRTNYAWNYGRWLVWLKRVHPQVLALDPVARVTLPLIRGYVAHLEKTSTSGVANALFGLRHTLLLFSPKADLDGLKVLGQRIQVKTKAIKPYNPELRSDVLAQFGLDLMQQAEAELQAEAKNARIVRAIRQSSARLYRDGLLFLLASHLPMRRANLADLVMGQTLIKTSSGWQIMIAADDVKTNRSINVQLPDLVCLHIDRFITCFRQGFFGHETHQGLWASSKGAPLCDGALNDIINRRSEAGLNTRIHLHAFRTAAPNLAAIENPTQVLSTAALLGHASFDTTQEHYQSGQSRAAAERHAKNIENLLKKKRD